MPEPVIACLEPLTLPTYPVPFLDRVGDEPRFTLPP